MADVFNLPAVGDTMVEGEIVEWFVAVGDVVDLDQIICSLETDKSVVEMSTPYRGTVLQLGAAPGEAIPVGSPLIVVGQPGESVPQSAAVTASPAAPSPAASPAPAAAARPETSYGSTTSATASPVVRKLAVNNGIDLDTLHGTGQGGRVTRADVELAIAASSTVTSKPTVRAMPKVRKAAREQGLDLSGIGGSGPSGAITLSDVFASPQGVQPDRSAPPERREKLSAMRRAIGHHLTESVQTIPQFTSMVECDASALLDTRRALSQRLDTPVPIDAVLMALLIPVLRDHPIINATLDGDEIVYFGQYNLGVAVDTPQGLMVPVVHNADQLSAAGLASEIVRLANAARNRTIQPQELTGATFTVNNVGSLGILFGTPILPLGTSTIVAFGVARPVVQLRNGNPVEVPTMTISGTFDHRIIDGGHSGRFLAQLKQHIEVPALGFLD